MHGGAPNNPFLSGPTQPTVSTVKAPTLPPKALGSAKLAHRPIPGGPGATSGPGVAAMKKEGASPNLEARDTKDGIKKSPGSRPASQPSKPGPGGATPSANNGLQPGGSAGTGAALSPGHLVAQHHQHHQQQRQAAVNQSPSLLGPPVGAATGPMLNGLSGAGGAGGPSSNPGAIANPTAPLPSAGLDLDFNPMTDFFTGDLSFLGSNSGLEFTGLGSGTDGTFMDFFNMPESMDNNLMG